MNQAPQINTPNKKIQEEETPIRSKTAIKEMIMTETRIRGKITLIEDNINQDPMMYKVILDHKVVMIRTQDNLTETGIKFPKAIEKVRVLIQDLNQNKGRLQVQKDSLKYSQVLLNNNMKDNLIFQTKSQDNDPNSLK